MAAIEIDRNRDVLVEDLNVNYTAPAAFDDIDPCAESSANTFSYAPWFDRRVVSSTEHSQIFH